MKNINVHSPAGELSPGGDIYGSGNSKDFRTGDWRTSTPTFYADKCKQCLLCAFVCPDSCIPVTNGERAEFDLEHCKGCGICAEACKFGAIVFEDGKEA